MSARVSARANDQENVRREREGKRKLLHCIFERVSQCNEGKGIAIWRFAVALWGS